MTLQKDQDSCIEKFNGEILNKLRANSELSKMIGMK
jgi:hypothetical protein